MSAAEEQHQQKQQQQQSHRNHAAWTLPCHFHTLSLMNCKSRAEAFAKSLHTKLKSLGRLAAEDDEDEDGEEAEEEAAIHPTNPFAPQTSSSSSIRCIENEKTHLISAPHHGSPADSFLSQHGEDELYFDFDISSPESPAEQDDPALTVNYKLENLVTKQPKSRQNASQRSNPHLEHACTCAEAGLRHGCCSNPDSERKHAAQRSNPHLERCFACSNFKHTLEFTNSNLRNLDAANGDEESGCISGVSSVLTEQDNDEVDDELFGLHDFEDAADLYPWSPPEHFPQSVMAPECSMVNSPTSPVRKLTTIVEQATLEQLESSAEEEEEEEEEKFGGPSDDIEELRESNGLVQGQSQCGYVSEAGLLGKDNRQEETGSMLHGERLASSEVDDVAEVEHDIHTDSGGCEVMPSVEGPSQRRVRPDESADIQAPAQNDKDMRHASESSADPRESPDDSRSFLESSDACSEEPFHDHQQRENGDGRQSQGLECQECESQSPSSIPNPEDSALGQPERNEEASCKKEEDPSSGSHEETVRESEETVCQVSVSPPPTILNLREHFDFDSDSPSSSSSPHQQLTVNVNLSPATNGYDSSLSPTPDDEHPGRVRRSSSLKTGKTPPGTPNRKKIVRFADAMGLDLEAVKHVFLDDLPTVPSSAFVDLQDAARSDDEDEEGDPPSNRMPDFVPPRVARNLVPVFPQPASLSDFVERLRRQSVCLESAVLAGDASVRLVIRVLNLDFHKSVSVRYTFDGWTTVHIADTEYVQGSHDGFSDKFATVLSADEVKVGERLQFAVKYVTMDTEFWDNNYGQNYCFQCFAEQQYQPSPTDDSWVHFL